MTISFQNIYDCLLDGAVLVHTIPNESDEQHYYHLKEGDDFTEIKKSRFDRFRNNGYLTYMFCFDEQHFVYGKK